MNLSHSELRQQRDLVKRHLDWLDARLAESEATAPSEPATPPLSENAAESPAESAGGPPDTNAEAPHPAEVAAEVLIASYSEEQQGLSSNTKAGCVIAAATVALLFLFVLFGLPYLLYGKKTGEPTETPEMAHP